MVTVLSASLLARPLMSMTAAGTIRLRTGSCSRVWVLAKKWQGASMCVPLCSMSSHQGDGLTAPATAEEAEVARRLCGDPLDDGRDPRGGEAKGPAGLVPGQALYPFLMEPLDPAV